MNGKNLFEHLKHKKNTNAYNNKYGFDLIITILLLGGLLSGNLYLYLKNSKKYLKNNWKNERCKPYVLPFAGYIHSDEKDIFLYTTENFSYCLHGILKGMTGSVFAPLTIVITSVLTVLNGITSKLEPIRGFFNGLMGNFEGFLILMKNIIAKFMAVIVSIFENITNVIGGVSKIINYNFELIGIVINLIKKLLIDFIIKWIVIGVVVTIVGTVIIAIGTGILPIWIVGTISGLFVIMAGSLVFGGGVTITAFSSWLHYLASSIKTPQAALKAYENCGTNKITIDQCCFDKNTILETINGKKKMHNIKISDILKDGSIITGIFKMEYNKDTIYKIGNILVTEEHPILYKNKWVRVDEHPESEKIIDYNKKYLYCINTTSKKIEIDNYIFQDWDELDENDIEELKYLTNINNILDINLKLEHGFHKNTKIKLIDNTIKNIEDIKPGDILLNNNKVLGVAILNGKNNETINEYLINNEKLISTSNTIEHIKENKEIINKNLNVDRLYSLITSKKYIKIYDIEINDYNYGIEKFIK